MAASFPGGAVQSASAAHGQMNFMPPAQMRVQMAAKMAQLGSAASDAAGVRVTTPKESGSSGGAGRGACGIESLAARAPGGAMGAAIPDARNFAMTKAPPRQQQSLSVQDPHLQNQSIQQSTQVQQQLQSTPASQGDVIGVDQKWMETNIVPSSSPSPAYSMSSLETDRKLLRTGQVTPASSNTSSANADVPRGAGVSGDSSLDSSGRGRGAGSNNGSSESSSTSRLGVLLNAKMGGDTTGGGIGGRNICSGSEGGGGSEGVVAFSPSGFQGRLPPQAPSSIDRGSVGSSSRVADSGTSTAENALGMAAAVASFYNELPGSTDGRVDVLKTGAGQMPAAGPGTTGSGWGGGGKPGGLGVRVGGGGVQTTRLREGMDWQQVVM